MKKLIGIVICIFMAVSTLSVGAARNDTQKVLLNPEPAPTSVSVNIYNKAFHPHVLIVDLNTTVTWTNLEPLPHSVISDTGLFRSNTLDLGDTFSYKFVKKDNYPYHDGFNPNITGRIVAYPGGNQAPTTPVVHGPLGINETYTKGVTYNFTAVAYDPEGLNISYFFDWGDDTNSGWTPYVNSGTLVNASHMWSKKGTYAVKVQAKDFYANATSAWGTLSIKVPTSTVFKFTPLIQQLLERLLRLFPFLEQLLG